MRLRPAVRPRNALRLSRREWRDLAAAQVQLCRAQLAVWLHAPWQLGHLAAGNASTSAPEPTAAQWRRVAALERAIHRATRFGLLRPRPKCLAGAVALAALIRDAGITGAGVRIGVRREDGALAAHAWVDLAGRVVGDTAAHVAAFSPLANLAALRDAPARW